MVWRRIEEPSYDEIRDENAAKEIRNGKATGFHKLTAELIKKA